MKLILLISILMFGGLLSRALTWAQGIVEGFEGGAVVLPCTVSTQGALTWRRGNVLILIRETNGSPLPPENSAWKDVVSFVDSSNNLSISPLSRKRDDGFTFRCEGTPVGQQETTIRVLARITGASIEQASGGQVTVTEGTSKTLTCALTGKPNPPPSYSWRVDNGGITGQRSNYTLTANRSMRNITCTATNMFSNGRVLSTAEARATLNVLYLDTPSAVTHVNVTENEAATLRCSAQGNPLPNFEWRRSGSTEVMSTSADYRIENVQRSAAGEYTCDVTNSVGSRQTRVNLVVQYPPVVTVTYDQSTHTLTCTAEGVPDTYTFSSWEQRLGGTLIRTLGTQTNRAPVTLQLNDTLTYTDTGDYMCSVTNGINSPETGLVHVAPPTPAVFQKHPERVTISLGKTQTISVPFYARPSSGSVQVKWEKAREGEALQSHQEEPGQVSLVVYGQPVSLQGTVTTLTVTSVSRVDEGNYSVTVTTDINGMAKTSETSFYVNVTKISEAQTAGLAPIVGGVTGGVVLIAVIVIVIAIVLKWRSGGAGRAGGKDEKSTVNEQLVDSSEKTAFSDPRWRQSDAEVAENELYEGMPFNANLPPQDKRPPKPARTFEHNSTCHPSDSPALKDGGQEMEMAENTMNASADPKTKTQKNGTTKAKKGRPGIAAKPVKTAKTQLPVDDSYEQKDFTSTGANNNNPPAPQRRKLNYQEVAFDKTKKPQKSHPWESPTEYAGIKFSQRQ